MTGVLRELAANPGGFARDFTLAKRAEDLPQRRFELAAQAVPDESGPRDAQVERNEGPSLEAASAVRKQGARRTSSRQLSEVPVRTEKGGSEQLPSYFRRRSEALPGTYGRTGNLSALDDQAAKVGGATSVNFVQGEAPIDGSAPQAAAMAPRESFVEEQQSLREPAWMRRAARAAGESRSLTAADEAVIRDLKKLERELMGREMEQARAGGGATPKGHHMVETGPDGERYVTHGEASPSIIPGGTPEQELVRARAVRRATQALSSPSTQDLAVASEAARLERAAEKKIEEEVKEVAQTEQSVEESGLLSVQDSLAQEIVASARREELRASEERSAVQREEARASLNVSSLDNPNIPNAEVVTLQRQVAIDAYLTQL